MKEISEKIAAIPPSATIAIADKAREMKASGIDVISLSIGEPDFDTPAHITDACIDALRAGKTHYAPSQGIPELLDAIVAKAKRENAISASRENVIVTCGAKDAIHQACEAVLNLGDEVLIIDPSWVSYEPAVIIAGGKPVHHSLSLKTFQLDDSLLERVSQKTKMVVFSSPSNPTGSVLNERSLRLIRDLCVDYDIFALSDEIYEKLIYGKIHHSLASMDGMAERTITVNGFSKAYAMTGWRVGYAVAPPQILRQMIRVQQHTVSHPATFAMYGALAAITGDQSCVEQMRSEFEKRRDYVLESLEEMGFRTAPADGAFYAFLQVEGDDMDIAEDWLSKAHVAVTPGTAFCAPGWLRLSYAASMDVLEVAMERIAAQ